MAGTVRGIVVEIIGDDRSYIRAAERTIAANKSMERSSSLLARSTITSNKTITASNTSLTRSTVLGADQQIRARVKAQAALEASIAGLSTKAGSLPSGSKAQTAALALQAEEQAKLNRLLGVSTTSTRRFSSATKAGEQATRRFSSATKTGEHDLNKIVRGGLAGSGAFSTLGRSLAFASSGFIAFAVGAQLIRSSIDAARELAIAQRQVTKQLEVGGASWGQYGEQIDKATLKLTHLAGFTHTDLLASFTGLFRVTGSVKDSLRLVSVAADVARGRHIALSAASNALAKAAGGSFSALRRLNIIVPQGATKMQALEFVQRKYAGQAKAGTSAQDRFNATFVATQEIIGSALLPVFTRYLTQLGNWLAKMNESGRLQRDVNHFVSDAGDLFHTVGDVIRGADRVTGSFVNTLKILAAFRLVSVLTSWAGSVKGLAASWGLVTVAATRASEAEAAALGAGSGGGRGRVGAGGILSNGLTGLLAGASLRSSLRRGGTSGVVSRVGQFTGAGVAGEAALGGGAAVSATGIGALAVAAVLATGALANLAKGANKAAGGPSAASKGIDIAAGVLSGGLAGDSRFGILGQALHGFPGFGSKKPETPITKAGRAIDAAIQNTSNQFNRLAAAAQAFATRKTPTPALFKNFSLTTTEQIAQAKAALTKSNADDVADAKRIVARIKRAIASGHLQGKVLVQALGLEASALSTIWSAEDAAAQKRAQKAQAAKAKIQAQLQNSIDPLKLEIALSRAEAFGTPILPHLRALLRAAQAAIAKGLTGALEKQALDQITSLKQQIKDAISTPSVTFTLSPKLQLALARDEALGLDPTKDLLKAKAALLKFIRTHKHNLAALTDAYNQLAAINQQLGSTASSALGLFRQASTKALTAGLGLSTAQRKALRARLSQLGPGGTVPGQGVGAGGFIIDPTTGRPFRTRRDGRSGGGGGGGRRQVVEAKVNLDLNIEIDGRHVEATVTRRQQRRHKRNPSQRRGPAAGG